MVIASSFRLHNKIIHLQSQRRCLTACSRWAIEIPLHRNCPSTSLRIGKVRNEVRPLINLVSTFVAWREDGATERAGLNRERSHLIPEAIWSFSLNKDSRLVRRCVLNSILRKEHGPGKLKARGFADLEDLEEFVVACRILVTGCCVELNGMGALVAASYN